MFVLVEDDDKKRYARKKENYEKKTLTSTSLYPRL